MLSLLLSGLLTLVSLNCENLFDCRHDTLKNDLEWTPDGANHWTSGRYWHKLNNIGREILACGDPTALAAGEELQGGERSKEWGSEGAAFELPDLVALCEVENDTALFDLCNRSLLRNARYQYVMTDSPDPRGIDVALLYSPFSFRLLSHRSLRIEPLKDMHPTRDILLASGLIATGDTLHVFVVHAPSRSGGEHATQPHRMLVAERLTQAVDSLRRQQPEAMIVVCGDFNDYSNNRSIRHIEAASLTDVSKKARGRNGARGTYRFQGDWGSLDHIFASPTMVSRLSECFIFDAPFLLEEDQTYGGVKPRRNYLGPRYLRGFSDHLPLVARFRF